MCIVVECGIYVRILGKVMCIWFDVYWGCVRVEVEYIVYKNTVQL